MKKLVGGMMLLVLANSTSLVYAVGNGFNAMPSSTAVMMAERNSGDQFGTNNSGQAIGSTQPQGTQVKYYNTSGQAMGSAQTTSNGSTYYYNQNGQIVGYSLK
ncbi:MAG: hypothetical protein EKK57_12415 [Proteobacteria bacterium]|nr:MAG: hypothetical protein EKK57_12415 [Pseudomonadota bacterium]